MHLDPFQRHLALLSRVSLQSFRGHFIMSKEHLKRILREQTCDTCRYAYASRKRSPRSGWCSHTFHRPAEESCSHWRAPTIEVETYSATDVENALKELEETLYQLSSKK